jgi:IS5 family transposase
MRIGDASLAMRLREWAEHRGAEAALESVPYRPERPMLEARYRLTAAGHAIKRHGLAEIAQGPPMPMWGATAYNPADPWVVVNDGEGGQRLQRLERQTG